MRMFSIFSIGFVGMMILQPLPRQELFAQDDYQEWLKQQQSELKQFIEEDDKAFVNFLENEWRQINVESGLVPDKAPKPVKLPRVEALAPKATPTSMGKPIDNIQLPPDVPLRRPDLTGLPKIDLRKGNNVAFDYFGIPVSMAIDEGFWKPFRYKMNNKGISKRWKEFSKLDYKKMISKVKYIKDELRLNDWGYGLLLQEIAEYVYPNSQLDQNLFLWFVFTKSGYATKVGYNDDGVYLLTPSSNTLFSVRFFEMDDATYYLMNFSGKIPDVRSIYTYQGDYHGANVLFDLRIKSLPLLAEKSETRELRFNYSGEQYLVTAQYNENLVAFFMNYPQTDLEVYFETPMSPLASRSLTVGLKPIIDGKSEIEAVNILLRFVQLSLEYKNDAGQFGREKYLFADETLFYPFSDCEDRSILFAYLVRNLLGLEVVGLSYPGHIATAVHFSSDVAGEVVVYNNKKFVICDPTYINASIGMEMPIVQDSEPEVIKLASMK